MNLDIHAPPPMVQPRVKPRFFLSHACSPTQEAYNSASGSRQMTFFKRAGPGAGHLISLVAVPRPSRATRRSFALLKKKKRGVRVRCSCS